MSRPQLLVATPSDVPSVVEPLLVEYGTWVGTRLQELFGLTFTPADLERHHDAFRAELPRLLAPRGRLLLARVDHEPVGVAALRPRGDTEAEIKRMFVRPQARGLGIGRALLQRLIGDAGDEGYATVRLETLEFMTAAHVMYRVAGFVETAPFADAESAGTALASITIPMRLDLPSRTDHAPGR